jgi:hypothetical protein
MSFPFKIFLFFMFLISLGLGVWVVKARIIDNQPTTLQKAKSIVNPTYHYEYRPIIFGCAKQPVFPGNEKKK